MYDIHCHLAYGLDDGSRSIEESIEMINIYKENGFKGAILTSHYDTSRYLVTADKVNENLEILREKLQENKIEFELYPGNEIQIDDSSISRIKKGELNRLNNSRYVLCELPFLTRPNYLTSIFYQMQLEGWIPIIAHPERYSYVISNPRWLNQFIKTGCLLQMNLSSLNKEDTRNTALFLLDNDMIHMVATDSHQSEWRSPNVNKLLMDLKEIVGEKKYIDLTDINPKKVIDDIFISSNYKELEDIENRKRDKRKWYQFWR